MFRNNENKLTPKQSSRRIKEEEIKIMNMVLGRGEDDEVKGEDIRPRTFPEHLWELVDPTQKGYVVGRFAKFKDKEYQAECVRC
jgi:hypothetical protein